MHCPPLLRAPGPHAAHVSRGPCPLVAPRLSFVMCLESGTRARALPHWEWPQRNVEMQSVGAILQNSNAASKARRYRAPRSCACPCAAAVRACIPPARPVAGPGANPGALVHTRRALVAEEPRRLRGPGRCPTRCGTPHECAIVGRRSRTAGSAVRTSSGARKQPYAPARQQPNIVCSGPE